MTRNKWFAVVGTLFVLAAILLGLQAIGGIMARESIQSLRAARTGVPMLPVVATDRRVAVEAHRAVDPDVAAQMAEGLQRAA